MSWKCNCCKIRYGVGDNMAIASTFIKFMKSGDALWKVFISLICYIISKRLAIYILCNEILKTIAFNNRTV